MNIFVIVLNVGKVDGKPIERTIADLKDGEIAYTVPWALSQTRSEHESGCLSIYKKYSIFPEPGGSITLKIKRQGRTILVDKSTLRERCQPTQWDEKYCWPVQFEDHIISHFVF